MLCERNRSIGRKFFAYSACIALLGVFTLPFAAKAMQDDEPLPFAMGLFSSPFLVYSDNLYRLSGVDPYSSYYTEDFVELCAAAYELKLELGLTDFFVNSVEPVTDDASAWFWVDTLTNERIIVPKRPANGIERFEFDPGALAESDVRILIVQRGSMLYAKNREYLESFPKARSNSFGFVIII